MAIDYVCRECGKTYSQQAYAESRFCKACGSFLLPRFNLKRVPLITQRNTKRKGTERAEDPSSEIGQASRDQTALRRAAESLRQKIADAREYKVISEPEKETTEFGTPVTVSWIRSSEYYNALKLKEKLIHKFKGKDLEEAIPGKTISNEHGECYSISGSCVSKFEKASYEESKRRIISDLKLIPGIGLCKERILKEQGYTSVEKLANHPVWNKPAQKLMNLIDSRDVESLQNWLWQRLPKSHPLAHYLAGFCKEEDFAIIDIETLGLSERPIVLLGIGRLTKTSICTSQFLLRDIPDEPSAIWALLSKLEPESSLITFNGRSFDLPYIKQRLAYYGIEATVSHPHFDVLHFTRRALRNKLPDCRLETVEKYLGIKRGINIPGALVPQFYDTYLKTGNVGPLVAIAEHNKQDLITLANLFSKLYEEWNS